jgi:hypothetical protein
MNFALERPLPLSRNRCPPIRPSQPPRRSAASSPPKYSTSDSFLPSPPLVGWRRMARRGASLRRSTPSFPPDRVPSCATSNFLSSLPRPCHLPERSELPIAGVPPSTSQAVASSASYTSGEHGLFVTPPHPAVRAALQRIARRLHAILPRHFLGRGARPLFKLRLGQHRPHPSAPRATACNSSAESPAPRPSAACAAHCPAGRASRA